MAQQQKVDVELITEIIEDQGVDFDPNEAPSSFLVDYQKFSPLSNSSADLLDSIDLLLTANQLSAPTKNRIISTLNKIENRDDRIKAAVLMVMTSTDYIVQQ